MFVYYRLPDRGTSFRHIADRQICALRGKGHLVLARDLWFTKDSLNDSTCHKNSIALVHPIFYHTNWFHVGFDQIMEVLRRRHRSVYGFEVGDTDEISDRFVQWANHPGIAGIMLPSQFSIDSFRNSGVTASLKKIPHGVEVVAPDISFDFLKQDSRPKILFFTAKDRHRKGLDLLMKIIPSFPGCTFVIKTAQRNGRSWLGWRDRNLLVIDEWLSPGALASLYSNCDVFLALHRGGAFELHCLEALAYGMPVLAPGYGAVLDYLTEQNATFITGRLKRRFVADRNDHSGRNFQCNRQDVIQKLNSILLYLDESKRCAQLEGEKIRRKYTWDKIAHLIVEYTS